MVPQIMRDCGPGRALIQMCLRAGQLLPTRSSLTVSIGRKLLLKLKKFRRVLVRRTISPRLITLKTSILLRGPTSRWGNRHVRRNRWEPVWWVDLTVNVMILKFLIVLLVPWRLLLLIVMIRLLGKVFLTVSFRQILILVFMLLFRRLISVLMVFKLLRLLFTGETRRLMVKPLFRLTVTVVLTPCLFWFPLLLIRRGRRRVVLMLRLIRVVVVSTVKIGIRWVLSQTSKMRLTILPWWWNGQLLRVTFVLAFQVLRVVVMVARQRGFVRFSGLIHPGWLR